MEADRFKAIEDHPSARALDFAFKLTGRIAGIAALAYVAFKTKSIVGIGIFAVSVLLLLGVFVWSWNYAYAAGELITERLTGRRGAPGWTLALGMVVVSTTIGAILYAIRAILIATVAAQH